MGKLEPKQDQANVNVKLNSPGHVLCGLEEKEFPCPICGAGLPIHTSKSAKPYCTCNVCGVQMFVRGKAGIKRLHQMANAGILISGSKESASEGINLLNRLEQLKLQKDRLKEKRGIIFKNEDVENVIRMVDAEIEKAQGELARIAMKTESPTGI
jgi:anion-transporting  ArsA/GET3 family ATPase